MNKIALAVGLVLAVPLFVLLNKSFDFDPGLIESPLVGKPAPDFVLQDLHGNTVSLEELRGQPVVVNFWATYCAPCIVEHPILTAAARRYVGKAHFLGIIYQDDPELIAQFVEQFGGWGPSLVDPDGRVAIAYGVYGPPETFFIDQNGTIVNKVIGAVDGQTMFDTMESML